MLAYRIALNGSIDTQRQESTQLTRWFPGPPPIVRIVIKISRIRSATVVRPHQGHVIKTKVVAVLLFKQTQLVGDEFKIRCPRH